MQAILDFEIARIIRPKHIRYITLRRKDAKLQWKNPLPMLYKNANGKEQLPKLCKNVANVYKIKLINY